MPQTTIEIIILAAGLGTRMKSSRVKILHRAGGRPLIEYVLDLTAALTGRKPVMVVGHQRDAVQERCGDRARYVVQAEQLGTGHAVLQAAAVLEGAIDSSTRVLILSGDVPLTRKETLTALFAAHEESGNAITVLSMRPADPAMYGRIVRDGSGAVVKIVEAKDASPEEMAIDEVNAGIYVFNAGDLFRTLRMLSTDNAQGEYYLTDAIAIVRSEGKRVGAVLAGDPLEALGVNSRADLAAVERELTTRHVERLMASGVTFRNPGSVLVDTTVDIAPDTIIYPFVTLEGETKIGRDCVIESGVHLKNVALRDGVHVRTGSVAEDAIVESGATVGPYAHLRPGTVLGKKVKIGNFVETKKAVFADGSKASHLSYIGDAEIGADVNIGAGTITCNYDGVHKHKTILEDGAFIGSDTQLVAPVRVGKGAYVGAGSTITQDVPADALALSRTPQKNVEGWAIRRREKLQKK